MNFSEPTFSSTAAPEHSHEYLARPIPPSEEQWLREFERTDPQGARGRRLALMYRWTWTELLRYRQSGELPKKMDADPRELETMLEEHRRNAEHGEDISMEEDPQIEAYLNFEGLAPIIEWDQLDEDWQRHSTEQGVEEPVRGEIAKTLRQLIERIIESCTQYTAVLRAKSRTQFKDRSAAVDRSNLDATQRRSHDALIDHICILHRFVSSILPKRHGVQLSTLVLDPRVLDHREHIAHWAMLTDYFLQHREIALRRNAR